MKKAIAGIPSTIDPEHKGERHIYAELLGFLSGEHALTSGERRRVNEHLTQCIECQTLMGKYLVDAAVYLKEHGKEATRTQAALEKLSKLTHRTLKRDIPAYAETAENSDEDKAEILYPFLAAHLEMCEECQEAVHDIRIWLREEKEDESGEPSSTAFRNGEPSRTMP